MTGSGSPLEGFVFRQRLAQSEAGEVWRAEQSALERDVLVAIPAAAYRDAFDDTSRGLARLKSQLFPDVIDILTTEASRCVILEDAHARSILSFLDGKRLAPEKALRLAGALAEGLGALHRAHFVYGGLSPQRIFLTETQEPMLPDFSLMRREPGYGEGLAPSPVPPPAYYAAPELLASPEVADTRSDMFALGLTLYSLITGQTPFGALPPEEVPRVQQTVSIPSPADLVPGLPLPVAALLQRLTQRAPEDRYADWEEVQAAICQAKQGIAPEAGDPATSVVAPPVKPVHATARLKLSAKALRQFRSEREGAAGFAWGRLAVWIGLLVLLGALFVWGAWCFIRRMFL